MTRPTIEERFWAKIEKHDDDCECCGGCWHWTANGGTFGHGQFWANGRSQKAHRFAYELLVGPIPKGLHLDHLCFNPPCVNPAHLEPVTPRENVLRGRGPTAKNARKTHCDYGHEFTPENTRWAGPDKRERECLVCSRRLRAKWAATMRARRRAARLAREAEAA